MSKTILVTGASTGIGAETVVHLAHNNTVFIHYNSSQKQAEEVAERVADNNGTAFLVKADVMTEKGCQSLIDAVAAQTDHLDALVNNAGGLIQRQAVDSLEWDLMGRIFALNVFSVMKLTSLAVPLLRKGTKPSIVNITSVAQRHGAPSATIYGAAKSAIDSFTRGSAKELAPDIRVNAVAPGVIETPFHDKFTPPERLEAFRKATPLQINGQSIHIATAVKLLIENDFMTGETIDVNGGLFMR